MKDASAIHDIPRIVFKKNPSFLYPSTAAGEEVNLSYLYIALSNPKNTAVRVRLIGIDSAVLHSSSDTQQSDYCGVGSTSLHLHPPLKEEEHDGSPAKIVRIRLACDSPEIEIGSYEDELLIEEDGDGAVDASLRAFSSVTAAAGEAGLVDAWEVSTHHNVAYIRIPVQFANTKETQTDDGAVTQTTRATRSKPFVAELTLCMTVSSASLDTEKLDVYTKLLTLVS